MSKPLLGKLAFVTGAGSGIGRATCRLLERDGATIVAVDRNRSSAEETIALLPKGSNHLGLEMDVTSHSNINATLNEVILKFKRPPSIIVNSAGITRDNFLLKMSEIDFDNVINVNLKGTFLVTKAFAQAIVDYDREEVNDRTVSGGAIINLASISGKLGNMGQANYSASKSAVESFTRVASKEFGKYGIRVNAVLPGFIITPMTDILPDKIKAMVTQMSALKRFGQPEEIAEVIAFLASDRSSFVNGASIEVTGG